MNTKIKIILMTVVIVICLYGAPVKANSGDEPYQIYMPVVFNAPYVDPWIGPWSGYVVCMAANPHNPDEIYAGTWGSGVYKSLDGGLHWESYNRGLGDGYINSLAIDPQNPKIVYAGTYYDEVYKTTTGGDLWYQSSQGVRDGDIIYTIGIDPHDPDIIYIGTRNKFQNEPPWLGVVYRSINEGINWIPVLTNVGGINVQDWPYDVIVNPKDHRMVFAAFHEHGVYRSWDSGEHWEAVNGNGLTDLSGRALVINPQGSADNLLSVGTWHRSGTFNSSDNGSSWVRHPLGVKVYTMDLDPQQPNNMYLVDFFGGVYKSSNTGTSWQLSGLREYKMYTVMVNPARHNQIFAGTVGNGIFRSDDYGTSWVSSQAGLINTNVVGFAVVPGDKDHYLAVDAANEALIYAVDGKSAFVYTSTNHGEDWSESVVPGGVIHDLAVSLLEPGAVYAATDNGVYKHMEGTQWISLGLNGISITALAAHPAESGLLVAAGSEAVYYSKNGGINWIPGPDELSSVMVQSIHFDESDSNVVYLATTTRGVYRLKVR